MFTIVWIIFQYRAQKINILSYAICSKYLSKMNISNSKVVKLRYYKVRKNTYYAIIDANGNHVTFKAKGVMDYIVDFR